MKPYLRLYESLFSLFILIGSMFLEILPQYLSGIEHQFYAIRLIELMQRNVCFKDKLRLYVINLRAFKAKSQSTSTI